MVHATRKPAIVLADQDGLAKSVTASVSPAISDITAHKLANAIQIIRSRAMQSAESVYAR